MPTHACVATHTTETTQTRMTKTALHLSSLDEGRSSCAASAALLDASALSSCPRNVMACHGF